MKRLAAVIGAEEKGLIGTAGIGLVPQYRAEMCPGGHIASPQVLPCASTGSLSTAPEAQSTAAPPAPACVWALQPQTP